MGNTLWDSLPFADVDQGEDAGKLPLAHDFCPCERATYREITYASTLVPDGTPRNARGEPTLPDGRTLIQDLVTERVLNTTCRVTAVGSKTMCEYESVGFGTGLVELGARPGDTWESLRGCYIKYTYVRAVHFHGHECALIVDDLYGNRPGIRCERWYARGIGLVKFVFYLSGGKKSQSAYWVGKP